MEINPIQSASIKKPPLGKGVAVIAVFLLVVFGIWHFSSGIIENIGGSETGTTTTKTSSKKKLIKPETFALSYYNNWIKFIPGESIKETYPEKEYVEVEVVQPNLSGADATGWVLENSQGEKASLGPISVLPISGKVNSTEPLKIKAGDHLLISTGRSPIGVSFRVNKCSAYMEQFQDFVPPISGECPYITFERNFGALDSKCQVFIQSIHPCEANTRPLPSDVTASCKSFLDSTANYNGCVATHKNDADFYMKEWRIFLGKGTELWAQPNDMVFLLDEKGKLIDMLKY
jgi:hypothetical protein